MAHVDVYIFMCPNCYNNNPPYQITQTIIYNLRNESVKFGMLWFDIEQCDGCWNDLSGNCNWMQQAVQGAADLGLNIGIYSSDYEWGATVGSCAAFSGKYPLWYARK